MHYLFLNQGMIMVYIEPNVTINYLEQLIMSLQILELQLFDSASLLTCQILDVIPGRTDVQDLL